MNSLVLSLLAATLAANASEGNTLSASTEFPNPFRMQNGAPVGTAADWALRRAEIREMLLQYEYGHAPEAPANLQAEKIAETTSEDAVEEQIRIACGPDHAAHFTLHLTIPRHATGRFPVLLRGDLCWGAVKPEIAAAVIRRGYILAQFDRTELDGDNADRSDGVHPLYPEADWGTLAVWAWGYHRAVDYLLTRPNVDMRRIGITGHSRGGKTALLAGALDERIALVAPNDSGCGGAGSFRFQGEGSESLADILKNFPYWFHPRLREFIGQEDKLPFDQHFLLALVAPRPLLITNALGDPWANPRGTEQSYLATREVYRFLGATDRIGNWYREGKHEHNLQDWTALLDFADKQFFGKEVPTRFDRIQFPGAPRAFSWQAPNAGDR